MDIKEGGRVSGKGECLMGWGQGDLYDQNWGPEGGGCKKWQKLKMLIFFGQNVDDFIKKK